MDLKALSLSEILERRSRAADGDLRNASFLGNRTGETREAVKAAWDRSDDPFAMLLLLGILHRPRNVPLCEDLAACMSFFSPMRRVVELQAKTRPGMNYNGRSRHTFSHLAQTVRRGLGETPPEARAASKEKLSAAIRRLVVDPYVLPDEDIEPLSE